MSASRDAERTYPMVLTGAQRKVLAEILPQLSGQLRLGEPNQRIVHFTQDDMKTIRDQACRFVWMVTSGMKRNSLRRIIDIVTRAIEDSEGFRAIPVSVRLYQFKVSLVESKPLIWRRFQTRDCTLDRLHEHIQTAMGWTNSHLHHFLIDGQRYGDPLLMEENFLDMNYRDSTTTKISQVLPRSGKRFSFEYEYDFGDCWKHEVLFEGCLRADPGQRYPLCLEGERACPPEDVGGVGGYEIFLRSIGDEEDVEHDRYLEWVGGQFDPAAFDSEQATKRMRRGLPDWRYTT